MGRGAWQNLILKIGDIYVVCRFHPCNEILMRLYEIYEKGKKQDLTPITYSLIIILKIIWWYSRGLGKRR